MDNSMELDLELDAALAEPFDSLEDTQIPVEESTDSNKEVKLVGDEEVDRFEALPRPTAIFLHGVDNMSTKDIESYCNQENLTKVEWINDASCNLAFKTEEEAFHALESLLEKKEDAITVDHKQLHPAKPFVDAEGKTHSLFVRIATDEDVKERGARQRSRYYMIHGTENMKFSEERKTERKKYFERQEKSGGDGRSVFDRLGNRVAEGNNRRSRRGRSVSPSRDAERSIKRERASPEREIPSHLLSRLGPMKEEKKVEIKQEQQEPTATNSTEE